MALLMLEEWHRLRPGAVDMRGRGARVNPECEGKAWGCPGGSVLVGQSSLTLPVPIFLQGQPQGHLCHGGPELSGCAHSSQQRCRAGSGQDTMKGQRGAFWEGAKQGHGSKLPTSLSCAPAPRAIFLHGFGMQLLPLDWHGQKGSQGLHLTAWCPSLAVPSLPGMKGSAPGCCPRARVPSVLSL